MCYEDAGIYTHVCMCVCCAHMCVLCVCVCMYLGLMNLVDDLQALLEHAKRMIDNTEVSNPAKITYTIKQLAKEAVAGK